VTTPRPPAVRGDGRHGCPTGARPAAVAVAATVAATFWTVTATRGAAAASSTAGAPTSGVAVGVGAAPSASGGSVGRTTSWLPSWQNRRRCGRSLARAGRGGRGAPCAPLGAGAPPRVHMGVAWRGRAEGRAALCPTVDGGSVTEWDDRLWRRCLYTQSGRKSFFHDTAGLA